MTKLPDETLNRNLNLNVFGARGVGIGGDVKGSQIFTGDINIQVQGDFYVSGEPSSQSQAQIYLSPNYQASLVRIYRVDSSPIIVGVGFVVDQHHLVSCAHVISQALNLKNAQVPEESHKIQFDFPLLTIGKEFFAKVVHWDLDNDLAGLEIEDALPEGAQAAILKANEMIWGDSYQVFGFPKGFDIGVWAFGTIIGPQSEGQAQIQGKLERTGKGISPGFSGSPIWDTRLQAVVGMVRLADTSPGSTLASMLKIEAMLSSWPLFRSALQPRQPYRSLEIFGMEHAEYFFGRQRMVAKLQNKLKEVDFLAVVGPSGSGKSSLVQAGLIPALLTENSNLTPIIFRPGSYPIKNLATTLTDQLEPGLSQIERLAKIDLLNGLITANSSSLMDVFGSIRQENHKASSSLLVVDQFEEIFSPSVSKQIQQQFIELLLVISEHVESTKIVITVRADYFGSVLSLPALGKIVDDGLVNVLPMTQDELREAIVRPAELEGGSYEPGLVDRIIGEVIDQPGNLPLLQFALTQLWELRTTENRMTFSSYHTMGGVHGAIAKRAEEEYLNLQKQGQGEIVRRIFTRLVTPDLEGRDTRRRADRLEIEAASLVGDRHIWQIAQVLANSRLVVTDRDAFTGEETVEVAHEALIRNWGRLKEWVDSKREFYIWRQARLAPHLDQDENQEQRFLDEEEIVEAKRWVVEQREELTQQEVEFIYHSLLRIEHTDLASWLPHFGPREEVFAFLTPYLNDSQDNVRMIGVRALSELPKTEDEPQILEKLRNFVLEDTSLEVASLAAHGICRRGHIEKLVTLLNQTRKPKVLRDRLIKVLASTRNLPGIGHQVLANLKRHRRQVQIQAAILLIKTYRNELALTFVITFLFGLVGGIGGSVINSVIDQLFFLLNGAYPDDPLRWFNTNIGTNEIVIVLIFGLFATIQKRLIDEKPVLNKDLRPAITAVIVYLLLFILIGWTGFFSNLQNPEDPGFVRFDITSSIFNGFQTLIVNAAFASFMVFSVFRNKLLLDWKDYMEQSLFISLKSTALILLIYMAIEGVDLTARALTIGQFDVSQFGFQTIQNYFWSVYFYGLSYFIINGVRVFAYLLGFYLGLNVAFRAPSVQLRLLEGT